MSREGIVLVDKPAGPTSHDVVAKMRKLFNTRKVGHAGTLDPMATGMLVIGIGRATRLLGYFTAHDKEYLGTIRLGISTTTDDAQGDLVTQSSASHITESEILETVRDFRGPIMQQPSAVSAIKIDGKRAYTRVRDGEAISIPPRSVMINDLEIVSIIRIPELEVVDVRVRVVCSAGTYIRALARDIGAQLEVGGHLIELRRTRSGVFDSMLSLESLQQNPEIMDLATAIKIGFPYIVLSESEAVKAVNGVRLAAPVDLASGHVGLISSDGKAIGLFENSDSVLHPLVVFATNESF
ncbi:MAG: tRNA pseudouridine(55) synthase TruB [Actinobacteria bacterium]|jgi:tRNA pseudouridine55 synthase|nr:tRNA pseudouridine(55) synthase TruB [Actinomycetota bacterium]NBO34352.1 tRNA pseudouridine(55) synthase TruB [Actinomycetota bacterium]